MVAQKYFFTTVSLLVTRVRNVKNGGSPRIRFGNKISERPPFDLKNWRSFLTMATVSVCPKISQINQ